MRVRYAWLLLLACIGARAESVSMDWGNVSNPYLREVLFDFERHQYFSAIGHLLAERWRGTFKDEKPKSELMLAYAYLAYGMHSDATKILLQLPDKTISPALQNQLWLELANLRYQRSDLPGAVQAVGKIRGEMADATQQRKTVFESILLMKQQQLDKAIENLRTVRGDTSWAIFGQYNLGIALLRQNRRDEAIDWLKRVADVRGDDAEMSALRDRANYVLGYTHLRAQAAQQAKNYFQQIRLDSPFSNRALLGMGLTYEALREQKLALATWIELSKRRYTDRAVLEALLAVPYGYAQLGGHDQAIANYRIALDVYKAELQHIESAMESVRSGRAINMIVEHLSAARAESFNEVHELPDIVEAQYLLGLYESHPFQEALKNYRDLHTMQQQLNSWAATIYKTENMSDTFKKMYADQIAQKQTQLATTTEEIKQHIARLALAELERRHDQMEQYAKQALFGMAQIYDKGTER